MIGRKKPTAAIATEVQTDNAADASQSSSYMDSGPSTFLTDYLVICGRASVRSMDSASATLESPSIAASTSSLNSYVLCSTP